MFNTNEGWIRRLCDRLGLDDPSTVSEYLSAESASALATRHGVTRRTVFAWRKALASRLQPDWELEQRLADDARAKQALKAHGDALRRSELYTSTEDFRPEPPTITFDRVRGFMDFINALVPAMTFLLGGGSRELTSLDYEDRFALLNAFLPPKHCLMEWCYRAATSKSNLKFYHELAMILHHPNTIALAVHAADKKHSSLHVHVLSEVCNRSSAESLTFLQVQVGAALRQREIYTTAAHFIRYMDRMKDDFTRSLSGVHFGPACPNEVKVISSLDSLYERTGIGHDPIGALDAADALNMYNQRGDHPIIPPTGLSLFDAYLHEFNRYYAHGTVYEHSILCPGPFVIGTLLRLLDSPVAEKPPAYLSRMRYYMRVLSLLRLSGAAPEQFSTDMLRLTPIAEVRKASSTLIPAREEYVALGIETPEDYQALLRVQNSAHYQNKAFAMGYMRFTSQDRLGCLTPAFLARGIESGLRKGTINSLDEEAALSHAQPMVPDSTNWFRAPTAPYREESRVAIPGVPPAPKVPGSLIPAAGWGSLPGIESKQ